LENTTRNMRMGDRPQDLPRKQLMCFCSKFSLYVSRQDAASVPDDTASN